MRNRWCIAFLVTLASLAACGGPDVPRITREVTAQLRSDVRKEMERIDRENAALVRFYPQDDALWAAVDTVTLLREDRRHLVGTVTMHRGGDTTTVQSGITVVVDGEQWVYKTDGPLAAVARYAMFRANLVAQTALLEAQENLRRLRP